MTDAELLRGAQSGSADAWRTLYQRFLPSVWRQAYALVADMHAAEDITSETMLALLRGIDKLDADAASLAAWLRTVVHRKAMDHHRVAFRTRAKVGATPDRADSCLEFNDPGQSLENAEARAQVHRALDKLSERQRTVLQWKYGENFAVRDIAERLGETEKAVESALYRARREFRRSYEMEQTQPRRTARPDAQAAHDLNP